MKIVLTAILILCVFAFSKAQPHLEKIWQSDSTTVHGPESVLFDSASNRLVISSMNSGSVYAMDLNGRINQSPLAKGLNGNKGSAFYKGLFYTAETNGVAVVDLATGKTLKRIPVEGSLMLNDLAINKSGVVFVTDTRTSKVFRIDGQRVALLLDSISGANGLLCAGNDLYTLSSTSVLKVDATGKLSHIADGFESGLDGIVQLSETEFIISNYHGILYWVKTDGSRKTLLDTRTNNKMANDISFDPKTSTLYVPSFNANLISAFKIDE